MALICKAVNQHREVYFWSPGISLDLSSQSLILHLRKKSKSSPLLSWKHISAFLVWLTAHHGAKKSRIVSVPELSIHLILSDFVTEKNFHWFTVSSLQPGVLERDRREAARALLMPTPRGPATFPRGTAFHVLSEKPDQETKATVLIHGHK